MSHVKCYLSLVTRHLICFKLFLLLLIIFIIIFVLDLVGGGSVINGAILSSLILFLEHSGPQSSGFGCFL